MDKNVDDHAIDRISDFPDPIITIILSHLPVKESARTSILSKRWAHLWLLSPINVDDFALLRNSTVPFDDHKSWLIETHTRILSLHPGPILTCHFRYRFWEDHPEIVTRFLKTLTLKGIQVLTITSVQGRVDLVVPRCVLQSESLRDLELEGCKLPDCLPEGVLPNLKRLKMWSTNVKNADKLGELLSRCPIVELELGYCCGLEEVSIESETLRYLKIDDPDERTMEEPKLLVVEKAPNLERLIFNDNFTRFSQVVVGGAPKLEVLGRVNMKIEMLQLGGSQFDCTTMPIKYRRFNTRIHSMRTLAIKVNFNYVYQGETIPYLLKCFPCMETLDVVIDHTDYATDDEFDPPSPSFSPRYGDFWRQFDIECLNHYLKAVNLKGFWGQLSHLDFAKFIISKAQALKVMTIIHESSQGRKWVKKQRQCLCLENRASPAARVVFKKGNGYDFM